MAYAGKAVRTKRFDPSSVSQSPAGMPGGSRSGRLSAGRAASELDWRRIAVFAGGLGLGAAMGAGAALLFAPRSGTATRRRLRRRIRHAWTSPDDDC